MKNDKQILREMMKDNIFWIFVAVVYIGIIVLTLITGPSLCSSICGWVSALFLIVAIIFQRTTIKNMSEIIDSLLSEKYKYDRNNSEKQLSDCFSPDKEKEKE